MTKINYMSASMLLLVALMIVNASDTLGNTIILMEEHWIKVVDEPDASKRKSLIDEHRKIMADYSSIKAPAHNGAMADMHSMTSHDDVMHMQNTIDLHEQMIDLIQ